MADTTAALPLSRLTDLGLKFREDPGNGGAHGSRTRIPKDFNCTSLPLAERPRKGNPALFAQGRGCRRSSFLDLRLYSAWEPKSSIGFPRHRANGVKFITGAVIAQAAGGLSTSFLIFRSEC